MDYKAYYLSVLKRLVEIPSISQDEENCAIALAEILTRDLGMDVELERVENHSVNVYGTWKNKTANINESVKRLVLGGHIDVVAPGEGWITDPFHLTILGDLAYGRGTFDMKGGLAAQIAALKLLYDENWKPEGEIELVGFCDEERLSIGANAYVVKNQGIDPSLSFGIFGEPHFDNIVIGATGKVLLGVDVTGLSGHAAEPDSGVNAISCLSKLISSIDEKYNELYKKGIAASHSFLKITSRWEGYSLNIPDHAEALLNKQLYLNEDVEAFLKDLHSIYDREVGQGELNIAKLAPYYPSYQLPKDTAGLSLIEDVLREQYSFEPVFRINQSVSDANVIYPLLGIPVVLFGPDGANLHKPNEYLSLSSAYSYIDMIVDIAKRYFS